MRADANQVRREAKKKDRKVARSKYKDSKEACRVEIRGSKTPRKGRKDKKQRNKERTREKSHKERRKKDRKVQGANRTMNARKKVRLGIREGKKEETRQQEAVQLPDSRLLFCWPVLAVSVTSAIAIFTNTVDYGKRQLLLPRFSYLI